MVRRFHEASMTTYDPNNIFAKILRGELPCEKVYEDEHTFAFMDIMPRADGHVLVIPKNPSRNLLDADPQDLERAIATVQKLARAVKAGMNADGITLQQFNESAGGQVVFHLHFHILPRWEGEPRTLPHASGRMADLEELKALAAQIAAQIV
jgi:histidine triad (HIT) family protein